MKTFFTSDEHYHHNNIIRFCNRPFTSSEEMNEYLIDKFNSKVSKSDVTYHLGDFTLEHHPDEALAVLKKLNGKHYFLKGNHDTWLKTNVTNPKIIGISDYHEFRKDKLLFVLSHYPMLSWNCSHHGSTMLHGHCHSKINHTNLGTKRLDVGVDSAKLILGDYVPFEFNEINDLLDQSKLA